MFHHINHSPSCTTCLAPDCITCSRTVLSLFGLLTELAAEAVRTATPSAVTRVLVTIATTVLCQRHALTRVYR